MRTLRKLGFLTIGLFDGGRPRRRARVDAGGHRARRAARLRQRLGAAPAPAVRHLLAGRRPRRGLAAHHAGSSSAPRSSRSAGRTRCGWPRTWPPSTSSPAAGSTPASASARRCTGTTSRPRSTPTPPTSRTSATSGCERLLRVRPRRAGDATSAAPRASRSSPTGSSRTRPGCGGRLWYGGAQPAVGAVGRRARDELPDQQRGQGRGVRGLRRDPALAHPRLPRAPPRRRRARVSQGLVVIPTDSATAGAAREVRGVRRRPARRARPRRRARRG